MTYKPKITITIPAYNEAANIGYLIDDLEKQKYTSITLDKIIINSDGSTDKTNEIVKSKNNNQILLIENKETKGQPARQNEMLRMCNTEIVVLLNADIEIKDLEFIEKLVQPVVENEADLTSCPIFESTPTTFLEKAVLTSMKVKSEIFEKFNNGDNVYTCHGTARAFSNKLYTKLEFVEGPGEDAYSYLFCVSSGLKYKYVKETYIKYRLSNNFNDYRKQSLRFIKSKEVMSKQFGEDYIKQQYKFPRLESMVAIISHALRHPILSIAYFVIYIACLTGYKPNKSPQNWDTSISSKIVRKSI